MGVIGAAGWGCADGPVVFERERTTQRRGNSLLSYVKGVGEDLLKEKEGCWALGTCAAEPMHGISMTLMSTCRATRVSPLHATVPVW